MRKNLLVLLSFFLGCTYMTFAQDEVLFTVGDTPVKRSEFEYIYKKNNFSNKADYSRKSLEDYLHLYINFRLKVKEAMAEGLDQNDRFKEELGTYEKQLLDSYIDKDVMEKLVKQEYERGKTDVNVSHIYFAVSASVSDSEALRKARDVYAKIKSGMSFEEAAKLSEDKQTAGSGGKIGWVNSFQIAFPEVEEALYAMQPGEISGPVRSRIGYHILRLNETRPARPKLKAAIIKRFFPISDSSAAGKKKVEDSIRAAYAMLKDNVPFEKVVERYSEDETSSGNKGLIDWFGINVYAKVFEDAVYALKDGEYSQPFKTSTAWYIVKRVETAKPLSYEEAAPVLKTKLQNLPQYQYELDQFLQKLDDRLAVKHFTVNYPAFKQRLVALAVATPFVYRDTIAPKVLLQIGTRVYNENDFGKQIQENFYTIYPKPGMDKYDALIKNTAQNFVMDYYKNEIRNTNQEYKSLMDEYKNGIMIFSLSEKYIWNKASEDSAGLLAYYNTHKSDFDLKKRATLRTIYFDDQKEAGEVYKFLREHPETSDELLGEKMKALGIAEPKLNSQLIEDGKTTENVDMASLSKPQPDGAGFKIVQVLNPLPARSRAFEECRGYVVAAYQEQLEKEWVDTLKKKYPVNVNTQAFEALVKR